MNYHFIKPDQLVIKSEFTIYHKLTSWLLSSINLDASQISELFNPLEKDCHEAPVMKMLRFLEEVRESQEKLIICGDYDCDGVCATSLMVLICQKLEIDFGFYIPNRIVEGYGLNENTVEAANQKGYKYIVCVDNGVSAHSALKKAKSLGMKVAIIDHHVISEPPLCDVLLHPDLLTEYFQGMCGAGLVYLLCEHLGATPLMLSLATIATIGDMMPLWRKNREIVIKGCECLNLNRIKSIDLLHEQRVYTSTSIAFNLVPKINAVGRLADRANINNVVRYFTTLNDEECSKFAVQINDLNQNRKAMGKQYVAEALQMIDQSAMIIIQSKNFHEGLVGIVAGQLSQAFQKPTLVLANRDGLLKGSARSQGVSLFDLFSSLESDVYEKFGGHDHAAGIELREDQFEAFKIEVLKKLEWMDFQDNESIDVLALEVSDIDENSLLQMSEFEPFGQGFKLPLVSLQAQAKPIRLGQAGYKWQLGSCEVVYFGTRKFPSGLADYTFIGTLGLNEFRGKRVCQLKAEEIFQSSLV